MLTTRYLTYEGGRSGMIVEATKFIAMEPTAVGSHDASLTTLATF